MTYCGYYMYDRHSQISANIISEYPIMNIESDLLMSTFLEDSKEPSFGGLRNTLYRLTSKN